MRKENPLHEEANRARATQAGNCALVITSVNRIEPVDRNSLSAKSKESV
jgi:hypothetical protein